MFFDPEAVIDEVVDAPYYTDAHEKVISELDPAVIVSALSRMVDDRFLIEYDRIRTRAIDALLHEYFECDRNYSTDEDGLCEGCREDHGEECSTDDCTNLLDDGEGWDGKCGTCADRDEAEEN